MSPLPAPRSADADDPRYRPDPGARSAAPAAPDKAGPVSAEPNAPPGPRPPPMQLVPGLAALRAEIAAGPLAIILIEDDTEVVSTLEHFIRIGFRRVLALSPEPLTPDQLPDDPKRRVINLIHDSRQPGSHVTAVNAIIDAVPPGIWIYYGFNAEYLYYPFAETRTVGELLAFHLEERRQSMLTYVIDLYAPDLTRFPSGVSRDEAMFDRTGYYALGRPDGLGGQKERQLDFHGGLRWRFEELLPVDRRRLDRIALFRTEPGLRLLPDHRMNVEEMNTYACPWHNNLTAAVASFRVAKALSRNPGSRHRINGFAWRNSVPFYWNSQQLMDLGLMEPGQWF